MLKISIMFSLYRQFFFRVFATHIQRDLDRKSDVRVIDFTRFFANSNYKKNNLQSLRRSFNATLPKSSQIAFNMRLNVHEC